MLKKILFKKISTNSTRNRLARFNCEKTSASAAYDISFEDNHLNISKQQNLLYVALLVLTPLFLFSSQLVILLQDEWNMVDSKL